MATSLASLPSLEAGHRNRDRREPGLAIGLVTMMTLVAVAVNGYHPYAEDGGLYLPEIKRLLRPELYPHGSEFVVGHLRLSIFAPMIAQIVRWSHLRVDTLLLLVHLASVWMTLFAAWLLAARCYDSREARCGAVTLLTVWMTLPVAGTSLMLMDPYVTARSIATPCALLALVGALMFLLPRNETATERRWGLMLCCGALAGAGAMHSLMAAYALGCVMVLGCVTSTSRKVRVGGTMLLCAAALVGAGAVQLSAIPESAEYRTVVMTRSYWFLGEWRWYEWIGLMAPLTILAAGSFGVRPTGAAKFGRGGFPGDAARRGLMRMGVVSGITALVVALLFARTGMATHLVARLQPLRIFQQVYVVMILVVGAALGERVLKRSAIRWVVVFSVLAGVMVYVERQIFPNSARIELPSSALRSEVQNPWQQAFVWISKNTPQNALFAMDPHYITAPGEDAQGFRAIAERSVLPDYSKDGGVVANNQSLTAEWVRGQAAQSALSTETDAPRITALQPLGVGWVVLDTKAATGFRCDFANSKVKVCRLP